MADSTHERMKAEYVSTTGENLAHRAPLLLLDEVTQVSDTQVVASRTFREDEEFFKGHFESPLFLAFT